MTPRQERIFWSLAAGGAAIGAGLATRSALSAGWRRVKGVEPPENPDSSEVSWGDAIAWTALTGAVVGISRLVATRLTATGWEKLTRAKPPED